MTSPASESSSSLKMMMMMMMMSHLMMMMSLKPKPSPSVVSFSSSSSRSRVVSRRHIVGIYSLRAMSSMGASSTSTSRTRAPSSASFVVCRLSSDLAACKPFVYIEKQGASQNFDSTKYETFVRINKIIIYRTNDKYLVREMSIKVSLGGGRTDRRIRHARRFVIRKRARPGDRKTDRQTDAGR